MRVGLLKKLVIVCLVTVLLLNIHINKGISRVNSRELILQKLGQFNDAGKVVTLQIVENIAYVAEYF